MVSDRPVYLTSRNAHSGWANSRALELAGITRDTPDPVDGIIDRDANGEPLGSVQARGMDLVTAHIPPPSLETMLAALRHTAKMLNAYGVTSIQAAFVDPSHLPAYRELDRRGELTLRVVTALYWNPERGEAQLEEFERLRDEFSHDRVRVSSVKIWQDGVVENFTAALLEPYVGMGDQRGMPMQSPAALQSALEKLDAAGFQAHFHAVGDAGVRQSLDAVAAARAKNGERDNRHHISHLQLIHESDLPRFRELGVIASFQPLWAQRDAYIEELNIPYLGAERSRGMFPIRSVLEHGGRVAFGSDWSVSSPNPLEQIETAMTRLGARGETAAPLNPDQAIDLHEAIAAFTIHAAFVNHREAGTGSLEVGKLADLVVLDRNLFEVEPEQISETRVLLTLLEGEPVYGDLAAL